MYLPNFFERYMAINRACSDQRAADPNLKTQLRFGNHDVELYTKFRGEKSGFKQTKLSDFLDTSTLPNFNYKVKWRRFKEQPPRRKVVYKSTKPQDPASRKSPAIRRENSNTIRSESKKQRMTTPSPSSSSDDEDENEEDMEEMEEESGEVDENDRAEDSTRNTTAE